MTAARTASDYRSGFCSVGRHDHCRGDYRTAVCGCGCHTAPSPEVLGEIATALTALTEVAIAAAVARHCPTCTCGDPTPA